MRSLHTAIEIDASPDRVWSILTDFPRYPDWNPFVRRIQGNLHEGARLDVLLQPPGGRAMRFRPTVQRVDPPHTFAWKGRLLLPGLFDGHHIFEIEALGPEQVRFVHRETFSGLLVPLLWRQLDTTTRRGFEAMNDTLKERAEATDTSADADRV
jgi:hypothetical protein